jgi:hypothetical protein
VVDIRSLESDEAPYTRQPPAFDMNQVERPLPFQVSWRDAVLAVVVAAVVAAVLGALVLSGGRTYESSTTLLLDQPQLLVTSGDSGALVKLNALRVKYTALVPTSVIAGPVAERLAMPKATVASSTFAVAQPESLLIRVYGRSGDPGTARRLAGAVGDQLIRYVDDEQRANAVPGDKRLQLSQVDAATAAYKIAPTRARASTVAMFAFVVAAAAMYALRRAVARRPR